MSGIEEGTETRILDFDGKISKEVYIVEEQDNRKGQYKLLLKGSNKSVGWVTQRRVLPIAIDGKAVVIESGDKYKVVCPTCATIGTINDVNNFACQECDNVFDLHWLSAKPMTEAINKVQNMNENENTIDQENQEVQEPQENAAQESADPQEMQEAVENLQQELAGEQEAGEQEAAPSIVDVDHLASLGELYTRKQLRFNHPDMDVKAHVLLIVDDNPRKLCFNTYNGTLGKRGNSLPIDAFQNDEMPEGKRLWFHVKNVDKQRQKLSKDGYERIQ